MILQLNFQLSVFSFVFYNFTKKIICFDFVFKMQET